jgi:hypothetical protein
MLLPDSLLVAAASAVAAAYLLWYDCGTRVLSRVLIDGPVRATVTKIGSSSQSGVIIGAAR